ncbi:MAG: FAD-binding oxidoreductase [Xanthobacteraceae bacterium]
MTHESIAEITAPPDRTAAWYGRTAVAPPEFPTLTFDLDVDVCVIGGGLAGLTVAREIARRDWSVALIEAGHVAGQASGRNLGFVLPGFAQSAERLVERCGLAHAKALWALAEDGVAYVRNTVLGLAMPGVDPVDGWLDVSKVDNADVMMRTLTLLAHDFGVAVEGWPMERVRERLKSDIYFHGLYFPHAFHVQPLNYALGLATDAQRRGARLFEETPALHIDPIGVRKRVSTPKGKIRANHIVLAGNVQLQHSASALASTILPMTTYVAVTRPLPDLADAVAFAGAVSDSHGSDFHYRVVDSNRLMWSGGATAWVGDPGRQAERIKPAIARTYPQLGQVEIEHVWSGTMGFAVHRMPLIGEISPGLWVASGFGGHGINTTAMAGQLIARAVVDRDDTWRLFLPYELVWAGGSLGRAAAQIGTWAQRNFEAARSRRARKRMVASPSESFPAAR